MSDFYILTSLEKDALPVDLGRFKDRLTCDWDVLDIHEQHGNESDVLMWDMDIDGEVVTGNASKDGKTIVLDGAISPVAKFVVWYRKLFHDDAEVLSLFEQSYLHDVMRINATTTEKEIIEAFSP